MGKGIPKIAQTMEAEIRKIRSKAEQKRREADRLDKDADAIEEELERLYKD